MIAVYSGGYGRQVYPSRHELDDGHLGGGILAGDPPRPQGELCPAPVDLCLLHVVHVRGQYFLRICQGPSVAVGWVNIVVSFDI